MFSVKMYDALNGVEKIIRHVTKVAFYNGNMYVTDIQDVDFVLPEDELDHSCIYISDDIQTLDDWGDNND